MSSRQARVFSSSVGTKILIGITGFALFLYLLIHIAGNLMVFFGPAVFNRYAFTLESNPLLPVIEIGLLLVFLIHIYKTVRMFLGNQQARPVALRAEEVRRAHQPQDVRVVDDDRLGPVAAGVPRHPRQGVQVRLGHEYAWPAGGRDLYRQEMENFSNPLMVGFYVLSMLVVGSHLWHGISSAVQSLGVDHPRVDAARARRRQGRRRR